MFHNPFGRQSEQTREWLVSVSAALVFGAHMAAVVWAMVLQAG